MATVSTRTPLKDSEGLILPKKLLNPCLESRSVKDLHREIKWNKKANILAKNAKSIFWGERVKLLVPTYQGTNETPL